MLKAMAKEPGQRYATAEQMAEDLRRFVGRPADPGAADRPGGAGLAVVPAQPGAGGPAGAVAAALVAVAVISVIYATEQARAAKEITRSCGSTSARNAKASGRRWPNRIVSWRSATSTAARPPSRRARSARACSG